TCRIPVVTAADMTSPIPRIAGELFTPTTPSGDGRVDPVEQRPPAAPLNPDSGFWTAPAPAVARPSTAPPVTDLPGVAPSAPTGPRPDAAPPVVSDSLSSPAVVDPGPAAPAWAEPDQDDLGGAAEDAPLPAPGRSARETGRVAVPDAGPITAPIPAVGPAVDDHLTGPVADEPITDSFAAVPAPTAHARRAERRNANRPAVGRLTVRATALALLLALVGGGASAVAMDKAITVTVDGQDRVVHTFAADVASALQAAGIDAAPQDRVEPALPTTVDNGDHVIFSRARKLILDEGPSQREVWTTAPTVGQALAGLGVQAQPIQMSTSPN